MRRLVIVKDWGVFQDKKKIQNGAKHRQNLKAKPGSVDLHQTLGEEFTFQQDNIQKHKANSILELLTKKTVNVPEWESYSFDLITIYCNYYA